MSALIRPDASSSTEFSTKLLLRILERPGLVAAVRELPGAVLGKLIDRIGLEDAGELVALASTAQLERVFDDDLWRAASAGGDETFRPERFVLWLRVTQEAGEEHLVRRLVELPQDLVALAVHRLVLVLDMDVVEEQLGWAGDEGEPIARALESSVFEAWEELRVIARDQDAWDDVWGALVSLDRDHHERLRAILEQCCAMDSEYISGQGGLYQVLTADEMLDGDVAAAREDRRGAEGFVSAADARAFLELARRSGGGEARDPITRAYFRAWRPETAAPADRADARGEDADRRDLAALLREAEVIAAAPARAALSPPADNGGTTAKPHLVAPLFEQAMSDLRLRDAALFAARGREVGYLVNVWIAGGAHDGRHPRPVEALETVLATCEAGLRDELGSAPQTAERALAVLARTPADTLFRRGFRGR
ncbi:MAG TPA: DUF6178 family protein [Polyangia bacterium]|nr:DUF6178 family protein [Polyangia bacterium]